jgi:xanthine/CO dehydrogenase XdhC/CoxF family maturation factor
MKNELPEMIALAERMVASDVHGTLATLFAARGSTYRPLGSMMVSLPGRQAGSVSGGCLDGYVAREGVLATERQPAAILTFSTAHETIDRAPVLGCGGSIDILVERLTPGHVAWLKELTAAAADDVPSVMQCLVDSSTGDVEVRRQWLHASGRAADVPEELEAIARRILRDARTCHLPLGDNRRALFQYVPPVRRLVLVGAGDDAGPICDLGKLLGWHVTVADRRARLATVSRFPHADMVMAGEWDEVLERVQITAHTAVVLMTHSLEDDACVLARLEAYAPAYIGALGPAQRREWLLEEVAANGVRLSAALREQICGPMGLDLGDRSPAGIAVAVVAEILARMNDRDAAPLSSRFALEGAAPAARSVCHA